MEKWKEKRGTCFDSEFLWDGGVDGLGEVEYPTARQEGKKITGKWKWKKSGVPSCRAGEFCW